MKTNRIKGWEYFLEVGGLIHWEYKKSKHLTNRVVVALHHKESPEGG